MNAAQHGGLFPRRFCPSRHRRAFNQYREGEAQGWGLQTSAIESFTKSLQAYRCWSPVEKSGAEACASVALVKQNPRKKAPAGLVQHRQQLVRRAKPEKRRSRLSASSSPLIRRTTKSATARNHQLYTVSIDFRQKGLQRRQQLTA